MATASCKCGKVRIQFPTKSPRATQLCCCNDCHARMTYLAELGGPTMPKDIQDRVKPITFHYFVNRMTVVSGKEELYFFLLRGGDNYNMATKCCNTFLAGHSLKFSGNCVAVPMELNILSDDVEAGKPTLRWFPDDLTNRNVANEDKEIPSAWLTKEDYKPTGSEGWEAPFGAVMGLWMTPVSDEENVGESYADLLEAYKANGGTVEIVYKDDK